MKQIKHIGNLLFAAFITITIVIFFLGMLSKNGNFGVPKVFGYQMMIVETGSMEPALPTKTGIVVQDVSVSTLRPQERNEQGDIVYQGDVITFYCVSEQKVITHRLLRIEIENGTQYYRTKGDANQSMDSWRIEEKYILGKVVYQSDVLGSIYHFFRSPIGLVLLFAIPGGFLLGQSIYGLVKGKKEVKENAEE